ncbi:MAG TPA: hypothetical protein VGV37_01155 [Aliidongia sp.]|nr:hypothetical protein [Aliidongia sp.]HEV2673115.1 hypothetical protein [Aliidongia sp.]
MPGLDPGIHAAPLGDEAIPLEGVDGRIEPGHDGDTISVVFAWK